MGIILWPNGETEPPLFSWEGQFGPRNADLPYATSWHLGQDFYGFEFWHAIADGEVVHAGTRDGWFGGGYMVWIQHDGFFSRSLHMVTGSATVSVGEHVTAGQVIGRVGNTPARVPPMAVHAHLEITPGQWHAANTGQIDPRKFLEDHVGGTATGAGGTAGAPIIESEEDDVKLYRVTPKGRHYAVAPGFIKQISGKESVMAYEAAAGVKEIEVDGDEFTVILGVNGIDTTGGPVVDGEGRILDERTGQGTYVAGGSWARSDKAERLAYLAQKIR